MPSADPMPRRPHPWLKFIVGVLLCSALGFGAYLVSSQLSGLYLARSTDDLTWLQREFDIPEARMERIRELHQQYVSECSRRCVEIAERKSELHLLLEASDQDLSAVEEKLVEIGALRARCQVGMLRHFEFVSQAMPEDQARRYLQEMRRLTLGDHESIERSMSPDPTDAHAHH